MSELLTEPGEILSTPNPLEKIDRELLKQLLTQEKDRMEQRHDGKPRIDSKYVVLRHFLEELDSNDSVTSLWNALAPAEQQVIITRVENIAYMFHTQDNEAEELRWWHDIIEPLRFQTYGHRTDDESRYDSRRKDELEKELQDFNKSRGLFGESDQEMPTWGKKYL